MLNELCSRILAKAGKIAEAEQQTPQERYLALCRHIRRSDDIIAECFDDWRRSTISKRIDALRQHKLLTDEHAKQMSGEAQDWLCMLEASLRH